MNIGLAYGETGASLSQFYKVNAGEKPANCKCTVNDWFYFHSTILITTLPVFCPDSTYLYASTIWSKAYFLSITGLYSPF